MPKPTTPIGAEDIRKYLNASSDFTFELRVLSVLASLGFACDHSGTYDDPVTQKTRQFDILAETVPATQNEVVFRLAVECKNLRDNYPLVAHRIPRNTAEAYVQAIISSRPSGPLVPSSSYGHRIRLTGDQSPYPARHMVAKSFDQVGKDRDGEVFADDRDVFDKLSQALNSSYELLRRSHFAARGHAGSVISVVVPIVVVPRERIWSVDYDDSGAIISGPALHHHVSLFVDRDWLIEENLGGGTRYTLSHLEIVTIDYLPTFVQTWKDDHRLRYGAILEAYRQTVPGPGRTP